MEYPKSLSLAVSPHFWQTPSWMAVAPHALQIAAPLFSVNVMTSALLQRFSSISNQV
jgi:hypothetical protein